MALDRQKDAARHRSTSGIAVVSAIAVALGTAAIIPGVYSQGNKAEVADIQQVADAEYTGGIRGADGNGAIEPAQQLASDIGSGSCTVGFSGQQGSKGGFSFDIEEPRIGSPNTREFGVNVKMDGSKDRTWRDFLVTGPNNNAPVTLHEVAAAAPGDKVAGESITDSTSSVMSIGKVGRRPKTATIAADLSADDIAAAASESGVSYGWKDSYTEDNTDSVKHIFKDPNVEVSVNPWPSENDNCSAISVDWVPKEKLVIRPGEEIKVGHINADANSMPRMVAEAYDAQGKYIGSSNTSASGGEQKLRIDDNGDIFYTVPKYKGTKLSAQQGTRFNVVAQPRTVKQLRDAIPTDAFGQVFEESNGPERYSKPNVISGHQWSLDDTQFHDPEYNPAQQTILSGVDSENGPVATGPQSVTFQQTGDKIADLMKSRDDGGVEAEVKLDTRYVYTGWKATLDPNTHEVTVTAPPNPAPGTFAQPRVIVTYTNGSQDIIPLLVVVDPNNTQVTNLTGPGLVQGAAGKPMTGSIDFAPAMEGHDPVRPTSFDVDPDTVPDGWKVEVKDDGTITVTATSPEDAANNSKITPKITAHYPDGTTDTVEATFQVTNNVKVPDYTAVTGKAKEEVKLQPAMPKIGLGGNADDEEPNRYTFPDGSLEYKTGDWTVTIDENTGELTSTIPDNALPGAQITVPVKAYYKSGANPQITTGAINVIGDGTGEDAASYPPQVTKAGTPVSSEIKTQLSDPKLGKYKLPDKLPPNWTFSIDENGTVTATPDESVPNGSTVSIPVEVTYPDGSTAKVPADFTVVDSYSSANSPSYPTVTGKPGTLVTSTVNRAHLSDAAEPKFSIITDPNDPSYIAPPRNLTWDQVKIDENTGEIITPISKDALPGSSADIPVRVTYKDGSSNSTIATVVVVARQNQVHEPQYRLQTTTPGQAVDSLITDETKVPERDLDADPSKRYSVPEDVSGWKVTVDENGKVTATAPENAKPGDGVDVPVTVTYLDGSTDTVWAPFKVKSQQKDINEPVYQVESTKPGTEVKRNINLNNAPVESTFSFGNDENGNPKTETTVDGWTYTVDPSTGEVAVTPPADAKPGDKHIHNVTVTYPDGSTDQIPVGTVVNLTNNYEAEPSYPPATIYPGDTVTAPLDLNLSEGVQLAAPEKKPFRIEPTDSMKATGQVNEFKNPTYFYETANGNWIVGLDNDGNVVATAPETAKPGDLIDVPVIVTYADGSKDTVTAPINVKEAPTREVPFDVEYKYDDTVPQGTYKVETEGVPGAEVQNRAGEWKQTKAPVNEVVVIGTKPAKASDEMTWTFQTGFDTITRPNPQLKPGEVKVVQEGEAGERTISVKFDATLEQGGVPKVETTSDTQTKDPKPRIVEYGPGLDDQNLVFTDKNRIPFETEIVYDPSLKAGEQVVDQKGEVGEETVTTTQKLVNGKPDGKPVVTKEQTKAPVKQKIRVGGKTTGENIETFKTEAPYGVVVKYDPNMPAGESKVTTPGVPGEKTVTIKRDIVNSKPGDPQITEEITKEPVDEVITVGTKQATATDDVQWTEPIPFGTTLRPNPELAPGETKVVQEGKNGEASYAAVFSGTNGEATVKETKVRTEPVERIVEYGPKVEDTTVVTKTEKPVPFETKIVFDDSLKAGEQVVDQQGELGAEVETSTQKIVDGKPSGDPEVTTERTKEPTNAVIRVGTKTTGETTNSVETEVPFGVKVEYDPTIPAGESKTVTEGKPGKKTVTVTQKVTNSKPDGEATVEEKVTEQPVDQVIKVGIKPAENSEKAEWTVPLPYSTTVRVNPDLKPGETRVVQKGENGEKSFTAIFRSVGDESYVVEGETTKEPVEEIIEYGPQAEDTSVVTKTEKPVPFETKIVFDDSLKAGEQVVDKQGENGTEVVTSTQKIVDGKPSGDPTVTTERTKEPTNAVIRVGTKTEGTNTTESEVEVPFETEIQFDDSLPAGTQETVQEGKPGKDKVTTTQTIENSKVTGTKTTTERVEEPVKKIIKVGTKPSEASEKVTWTAQVPFEVITRPNPELKPGEIKVVQKGVPGEKTYSADFSAKGDQATVTPEEKQTKDPVNEIIEYGPAAEDTSVVTKVEKPVPFETEIVFDNTLKEGEQKVDQQGETGTELVTSTQKIKDGKPDGDPTVSTERTKEPVKQIIRVGTKTEGTNTTESEVEVPFETEIQFDDSLPAGTQETVQEGKPGKDKVTTTQTIENSKVTGTQTTTERVEEPVKKIIKVGTKGETTSKTVEWTESTPFEVEVRENPELKVGETKVVQEGKPGEVKHTVTVTSDNGEITTDDSTETISEPTKQIIEVGTAPSQTELSDKHTEQLPFETLIEVDPNLEAGKVIEDQAGSFGEKEVTKVWKLKDGVAVGDPETTENVTKEPTPRKIRIGAKTVTETQKVTETEKVTETNNTTTTVTEKEPTPAPAPQIERSFYGVQLVKPGQSESQDVKNHTDGNTYEVPSDVDGWSVSVDENGKVTATAPSTAKSGDYIEVPVTVTPKDGKPYVTNAVFIVKEDAPIVTPEPTDPEVITAPTYNPDVIKAGDTKTVGINYGHTEGNTYELGEVPSGWIVTIDESTGELTVTPPADTPSGTIKEIPVKVTTKDGEVFNIKTVIGVVSDNCGCEPVEPNEPTEDPTEDPTVTVTVTEDPSKPTPSDEPKPTKEDPTPSGENPTVTVTVTETPNKPTTDTKPSEGPKDPTVDPTDPTEDPTVTVTVTEDPSKPTPSDEPKPTKEDPTPSGENPTVTVTVTETPNKPTTDTKPSEDPTKPAEPNDPTTETKPSEDPTKPAEPNDPDEPGTPEVDGLWPVLIPLVLVPAVLGHFMNQPHNPAAPAQPAKPLKPETPKDAVEQLKPQDPKAPSEAEQPNSIESNDVESNDVQPSQSDNTSRYTGTSPNTTDSNKSTNSGLLANTGANVLGLLAAGLALIAGAALLLRPGRRKES